MNHYLPTQQAKGEDKVVFFVWLLLKTKETKNFELLFLSVCFDVLLRVWLGAAEGESNLFFSWTLIFSVPLVFVVIS